MNNNRYPKEILVGAFIDKQSRFIKAYLYLKDETEPPRIKTYDVTTGLLQCDVHLSSFIDIKPSEREITQMLGDGPDHGYINAYEISSIFDNAMAHLPKTAGKFKVVWVPNDPNTPF